MNETENIYVIIFNSVLLIFLSGLFSAAETAFTNLSPARMEVIKNDNKFGSKIMYELYQRLDMVITLCLVLSNGLNILLATYLTLFFSGIFGADLGGKLSATIGTVVVIIFSEIIPKKIAILRSTIVSRFTAHILKYSGILLILIIYPLQKLNQFVDYLYRKSRTGKEDDTAMLEEEIKATLGIGRLSGVLENKEYEMMHKLLELNDRQVKSIMTNVSDMVAISSEKTLKDLVILASENNLSRIPVYSDSIDKIDYIIHIPQLSSEIINPKNLNLPISKYCNTRAFKIPESKILDDLFFEFQKKRVHMAIVIDEFGNTSGLITLEDIVEQIFGEIEDETDEVEDTFKLIGDNILKAEGDVTIEDVEKNLDIKFPNMYPKHKTLGWLVLEVLHRFPIEGERVIIPDSNIQIEVVDKDGEYIDQVKVRLM